MESYTFTPGDHSKFNEIGDLSTCPVEISYGEAMLTNFNVREVFIDGKPKGEYHIKIKSGHAQKINAAMVFFTQSLGRCEVGIIDPANMLNLEYQIFVKTSDPMNIMSMMDIMNSLDEKLSHNN